MTSAVVHAPQVAAWLGGASEFGLMLPDASPTAATMYSPRGVCLSDDAVIVADSGNHRILIWHGVDGIGDHAPADVVLGHDDMTSEGPQLLHIPTGILVVDGRLVVADAWHHRILVWNEVPRRSGARPDIVLGQDGIDGVNEGCGPDRFYWPFGVAVIDGDFWVADTGNKRVLCWRGGIPDPGAGADLVLGQPDLHSRGDNRGGAVAADSMRWPHAITRVGPYLVVADAGNHRLLAWRGGVDRDRDADAVLGQPDFCTAFEYAYRPQGPRSLRFPYAVTARGASLFVADTSNNRVLIASDLEALLDENPQGAAFDGVLGQPDLDANGENRWATVARDSLCWPYGLSSRRGLLAVADSGNNRVTLWRVP